MIKYKQYFKEMCQENTAVFAAFQELHDLYKTNQAAYQDRYNQEGLPIRRIVEDWDRRLCSRMEKGKNSTYSARLSEKFWAEVRTKFPLIDFVGVTISSHRK